MYSRSSTSHDRFRRGALAHVAGMLRDLSTALAVRKSRLELSKLNPDLLRDIGVTPDDVEAELRRSFWDIPQDFPRTD